MMFRVPPRARHAALGVIALIAFGLALLVPNATAQDRSEPSFPYALGRADAGLRFAIEEAPAELIANLASSKASCSEALDAERSGNSDIARLGWANLSETVQRDDVPAERTILRAFARSRSGLGELQSTFSWQWRNRSARVGQLVLGVTESRDGVRLLEGLVQQFEVAFDRWERHDCTGAQQTVTSINRKIPSAVEKTNFGMEKLRSLL